MSVWSERLNIVYDPEVTVPDLVEAKYLTLDRNTRDFVDPQLKPSREELAQLTAAISKQTHDMSAAEKELIWKFRYSLKTEGKALVKFLLSVAWNSDEEAQEATLLLEQWAPIEVDDALFLLSSEFTNRRVCADAHVLPHHSCCAPTSCGHPVLMVYTSQAHSIALSSVCRMRPECPALSMQLILTLRLAVGICVSRASLLCRCVSSQ